MSGIDHRRNLLYSGGVLSTLPIEVEFLANSAELNECRRTDHFLQWSFETLNLLSHANLAALCYHFQFSESLITAIVYDYYEN